MSEPRSGTTLAIMAFCLTPDDVAAAYRSHLRWGCSRPRHYVTMALGVLFLVAIDVLIGGTFTILSFLPAALFALFMLGYRPVMHALIPIYANRTFQQQKNMQQAWRVDLTENGLRAVTPTQDNYVAWADYIAWSQDSHVIMVYQSDRLFQFMPTRAATADILEIFRNKMADVPRR